MLYNVKYLFFQFLFIIETVKLKLNKLKTNMSISRKDTQMNTTGIAFDKGIISPEERMFRGNSHLKERIIHRSENCIIVANPQ